MLLKDAAKKDLLKPGDIISNATFDHTFVYAGIRMVKFMYMKLVEMLKVKDMGTLVVVHLQLDNIIKRLKILINQRAILKLLVYLGGMINFYKKTQYLVYF